MSAMRRILLLAATAMLAAPAAGAWEQSGSVTTPNGTWTGSRSTGCADGTCSRSGSVTGPQGQAAARQRQVTRMAPGQWSGTRSASGLGGRAYSRSWTRSR
ncbi:hypothetical protein [Falsiroseomonas tokyonensis]|uniref:Uncharacterized protein n=1 Tax=Falsiroseomonas tokyonensis TaxID=430521 RepID=A0ABV7BUY6_9PROT|nr:hypothetical protein [Falsiroseomonas tokyonensis]MBU8538236.1 hypothetical protein [Falsiroseomonas tokyonensis]